MMKEMAMCWSLWIGKEFGLLAFLFLFLCLVRFADYCVSVVRLLSHLLFIVYYFLHLRSRPHPILSPVDVFLFAAYITFSQTEVVKKGLQRCHRYMLITR